MTSTLTANRVSHADLAFDADHTTVVGTDDRNFMVGSFMELAEMEELYDKRGETPMTDDEHNRRVRDGQDK